MNWNCEAFTLLGHFVAYVSSWLLTFQDKLSVQYSRVTKSNKNDCLTLEGGTHSCPKTSVTNYYSTPHNIPQQQKLFYILVYVKHNKNQNFIK